MRSEELAQLAPGCYAEAVLGADLFRDLAAGDFFKKRGQRFSELLGFVPDLGTDEEKESYQQEDDQKINDGDSAGPSFRPPLNPGDGRIDQVGEENRKQKCDQGAASDVEKSKTNGKHEDCKQHPRRSSINQRHKSQFPAALGNLKG